MEKGRKRYLTSGVSEKSGLAGDRFPISGEEVALAEIVLANELEKLSTDEREKIIFDIHGISVTNQLDSEILPARLNAMSAEIEKLSSKQAYEHALFLNQGYVTNKEFQLLFLRSQDFDVAAAAEMLVDHFEVKRALFGDDALARDIRQSDLPDDDIKCLESGFYQLLPERDPSGRAVLSLHLDKIANMNPERLFRSVFYTLMKVAREDASNQDGLVYIVWNLENCFADFSFYSELHRINAVLPLLTASGHYCGGAPECKSVFVGYSLFLSDKRNMFRWTPHYGSYREIIFKLQTYGISTDVLPFDENNSRSTEYHLQWLKAYRSQEEKDARSEELSPLIVTPRRVDVLFGKSKKAKFSPGTLRALNLVDRYREEYETRSKHEKTQIAHKIISDIREKGGRFLKSNEERGGWEEVDERVARQKVAHWFRHLRSKGRDIDQQSSRSFCSSSASSIASSNPEGSDRVVLEERSSKRSLLSSDFIQSADDPKKIRNIAEL